MTLDKKSSVKLGNGQLVPAVGVVDSSGNLVTFGGVGGDASAANQVLQLTELESIAGLQIPPHDHLTLTYTGNDLTQIVYRSGGASGTTVATVNLGYTSGVLTTVARV